MTAYAFAGYRRGNTNGQRRVGQCIVTGFDDKKLAEKVALRNIPGAYKVGGIRLLKSTSVEDRQRDLINLYNMPCPIITREDSLRQVSERMADRLGIPR